MSLKRIFDYVKFENVITALIDNYKNEEQNYDGYLKAFNIIKTRKTSI